MSRAIVNFPAGRGKGRSEHQSRTRTAERRRYLRGNHPAYPTEGKLTPAEVIDYRDSDPLQCLLCGRTFQCLGQHLRRTHDLSSRAYCEQYGIPWRWRGKTGLATRAQSERMAESVPEGHMDGVHLLSPCAGPHPGYLARPDTVRIREHLFGLSRKTCQECGAPIAHLRDRTCSRKCGQAARKREARAQWTCCVDCGDLLPRGSQYNPVLRCKKCNFAWRKAGKP